jgi:hypothetical protein
MLDQAPLKRLGTYFGLSSVAVAQPIVDTVGSNPELLSATNNTGNTAWVFIIGLLLLPPLVTFAVVSLAGLVSDNLQRILHYCAFGGFLALLALVVMRAMDLDNTFAVLALAVALAAGVTYLFHRFEAIQQIPRLLAFLAPALLGLFALSASGSALRASNPDAVIAGGPRSTPPILFIVLDEFPLWPLLDDNGDIDSERLPGFGALSEDSTLYRNTVAPSNSTQAAVPSVMTGLNPGAELLPPFASAYPNSVFTLLGDAYAVSAYESTAALCTPEICVSDGSSILPASTGDIKALIRDSAVIYGHKVLPQTFRSRIPRIDLAWGNFAQVEAEFEASQSAPEVTEAPAGEPEPDRWAKFIEEHQGGPGRQAQILLSLVDSSAASTEPSLTFFHGLLPHRPWVLTPEGQTYKSYEFNREGELLGPEVDEARDRYQRFLMQLGYLDSVVGEAVKRLKDAGKWEETMVILVSDHGVHLATDESMRRVNIESTDSVHDIYRVPMFLKLPGQTEGRIDDCNAMAVDLLPTIIAVTESDPGWEYDGVDLAECSDAPRTRVAADIFGIPDNVIDFGFEELQAQMARYRQWVDLSDGADAFARVGTSAALVGNPVNAAGPSELVTSWTGTELFQLENFNSGVVPAQVSGVMTTTADAPAGTEALLVVDGIVAGVIVELGGSPAGEVKFSGIINPALVASSQSKFELAIAAPDGTVTMVGAPSPSDG